MADTYIDLNARIINPDGTLSEKTVDVSNNIMLKNVTFEDLSTEQLHIDKASRLNCINSFRSGDQISMDSTGKIECRSIQQCVQEDGAVQFDRVNAKNNLAGLLNFHRSTEGSELLVTEGVCGYENSDIRIAYKEGAGLEVSFRKFDVYNKLFYWCMSNDGKMFWETTDDYPDPTIEGRDRTTLIIPVSQAGTFTILYFRGY